MAEARKHPLLFDGRHLMAETRKYPLLFDATT